LYADNLPKIVAVGLAATGVAAARAQLTELASAAAAKKAAAAAAAAEASTADETSTLDADDNDDASEVRAVVEDVPSELELMLQPTFEPLEDELRAIIELADRADNFYVLGILVYCERLAKRHALTVAEARGGPARPLACAYLSHLLAALEVFRL
jgi:hypothetical protein